MLSGSLVDWLKRHPDDEKVKEAEDIARFKV